MNVIERAAETYCFLYATMVQWISPYVGDKAARQITRGSLADQFRWACNAVPTAGGPYAELAQLVMARAIQHGFVDPLLTEPWPMKSLPALADFDNLRVVMLYVQAYHLAYTAGWSVAEREEVYCWLAMTDAIMVRPGPLHVINVEWDSAPAALRRGVDLYVQHTCGEEMICGLTRQRLDDEVISTSGWF